MQIGTVKKVLLDKQFGFISTPGEPDTFFHSSALDESLDFDESLVERRVSFESFLSERGPKATIVKPAE